jgi:hypothetical protein
MSTKHAVPAHYNDYENFGYLVADGATIKREHVGETPNGNPMDGRWVLRAVAGTFVDFDRYRHDLMERNGIVLRHSVE